MTLSTGPIYYYDMVDYELLDIDWFTENESRLQPEPFTEYDSNGNQITSEVIGYTKDNEPIWC